MASLATNTERCSSPLGMEDKSILDSAITASSEWDINHGANNARIYHMAGGSRKGAWSARRSDKEPWIQINLGKIVEVTKVGSQGRQEAAQWVTKYKVSYSTDGHHFTSQNQEYFGNKDQNTLVINDLIQSIKAQYVRILPQEWFQVASMRVELYGCVSSDCELTVVFFLFFFGEEPVDGGYSAWGPYGECSKQCGGGEQTRRRTCTNPPPAHGGKNCAGLGPELSTRECNTQNCPIDGGFSNWLEWSDCSATCGGGSRARSRKCDNPVPQYQGKNCVGLSLETEDCNEEECPTNGGYSAWEPYGECTKTCGGGKQYRERTCTNPPPSAGGKDCDGLGPSKTSRECNNQDCPVNGGYTTWSKWSECSAKCGGGTRSRSRECTNPTPQYGGKDCSDLGPKTQEEDCNKDGCAVNGGYGPWGSWGECSITCGKERGIRTRVKSCDNPAPENGGKDCSGLGPDSETKPCVPLLKKCPVDGGWGEFGEWSKCPVTCGGGEQIRKRYCNNPKPEGDGKKCEGDQQETRECNTNKCEPEWRPVGCFMNTVRALGQILERVGSKSSISARYAACTSAADNEGVTLFGMDDRRCWTGEKAESTFSKYGTSDQCLDARKVPLSGGEWNKKGCYINKGPILALPDSFDDTVENYQGKENILEACTKKAEDSGYKVFGVDDKNCWADKSGKNKYDVYGESSECRKGSGSEIDGDMFVYRFEQRKSNSGTDDTYNGRMKQ
ncbi:hypothetical protein pdam_00013778 [Pocillopora damicornis]|uniref:F5/8 type C domain-containing protein n=1 Tax=Pocillopora damicornis TaxID=46731 RepID=A0A3M6UFL8_POCDA|nr:hypothetical protein pdam_00013778 [Pocillopora damicornis]